MSLRFKIITQERVVYDDEVTQATVPTWDGEITVLRRHSPLVSLLKPGIVTVKKDGVAHHMSVSSGIVEIRPGSELVLLADSAERAEEIDVKRAEEARMRAQQMLEEKQQMGDVEHAALVATLEKELARIKTGKRWKGA